jgi:hypothetical protein
MIWVRRVLTVPLGFILLILLVIALVGSQIGGKVLNPQFYPEELRKANIYEFVLVDLTTTALDEARSIEIHVLPWDLEENPLVTLGLSTEDIVSSLNAAIPPEYVQGLVEQFFDQVGQYVAGERDDFEVTVHAGAQVVQIVLEIKSLLRRADAYNLLFEEIISPAAEDALATELPLGLSVSSDRLVAAARRVVPPEWVQAQVEAALDEVTPYVVGERAGFEVRVRLSDRVESALEEIKQLLRETDAYVVLYDEIIDPQVRNSLGIAVEMPFGITITDDEITSALRQVAPPEWVQAQAEMVIDEASPYLTGDVDTFAIEVSLVENKAEARVLIVEIIATKSREVVDALPRCTSEQLLDLAASDNLQALPACMPPGVRADTLIDAIVSGVSAQVDPIILTAIPDQLYFTEVDLRNSLAGGDNIELLDDVRKIVRDGWTYTEADFLEDVFDESDVSGVEAWEDLRSFLAAGWTYNERDLREDIAGSEAATTEEDNTLRIFDRVRNGLDTAISLRLLIYLPVLLVLAAIGFLGGRSWSGRVGWAAVYLVVTAGVMFFIAGPVYSIFDGSGWDELRQTIYSEIDLTSNFANTQRLAIDKGLEIAESVAAEIASGIALASLILAVVGLVTLGVSLRWEQVRELLRF